MQSSEEIIREMDEKTLSDGEPEKFKEPEENLTLDQKLRMAISNSKLFCNEKIPNTMIQNNKTQPCTEENITGASTNLTGENKSQIPSVFIIPKSENNTTSSLKGKKIFKIKKYVKYNKFLAEICSEEEISENEKQSLKDPTKKKISPFSKVNFSKLKSEEKDERLKNLAKLVKRLRRKVKNLEHKVRFNATKLLNKHIWNKLGINTKNKYLLPEFQFDFDKICKALKKVRNYEEFEFDDQKHLIENVINLVAEEKLKIDSLAYRKICSILRSLIPKEKVKYISKKESKITISFPETEVYITNKEYSKMGKFKDNEEILRAVLGVYDEEKEKTVKVTSEPPEPMFTSNTMNMKIPNFIPNSNNNLFSKEVTNTPFVSNHTAFTPFIPQPSGIFMNNMTNMNTMNNMNNMIPQTNNNNQQLQNLLLNSFRNYYGNNQSNMNNMSNMSNMSNMNNLSTNHLTNFNNLNQMNQTMSHPLNMGNFSNLNPQGNNLNSNSNAKPNNMFIK